MSLSDEPWFQAFAGVAFRWQDAPTPLEPSDSSRSLAGSTGGAPVFAVVPDAAVPAGQAPSDVVLFNR